MFEPSAMLALLDPEAHGDCQVLLSAVSAAFLSRAGSKMEVNSLGMTCQPGF